MKYCILGSTGLLGQALIKECKSRNIDVIGIARKNSDFNIDISNDNDLKNFFENNYFDVVINTVAIVNHKICDENPATAYMINARPNSILAKLSQEKGFKLVYISTDGYFNGDKDKQHDENSKISLLNEYAKTKFTGENFSLTNPNSLVVRTNIVGFKGAQTPTFFEWALDAVKNQEKITLFDDYFTSSLSVSHFSKALLDLIAKDARGLYNLASSEVSSKKKFIETMAEIFNFELKNTITGSVSSLKSQRADSLGLDVSKAENLLGYKLPNLKEVLLKLKEEYDELQH